MEKWSFVAIIYEDTTLKLYVDGGMVNSKDVGKADAKPNHTMPPHQGSIWLATWKAPGWDFTGVLDEAGVFNTPLGDENIKAIMDNGLQKVSDVSIVGKMAMTWSYIKNTR